MATKFLLLLLAGFLALPHTIHLLKGVVAEFSGLPFVGIRFSSVLQVTGRAGLVSSSCVSFRCLVCPSLKLGKRPGCTFFVWFLLTAGDIEVNPGPVQFPCMNCCKPVRKNQYGILCDGCEKWCHRKCIHMDRETYLKLGSSDDSWYCVSCSLPAFSDSYFEDIGLGNTPNNSSVSLTEETGDLFDFGDTGGQSSLT